MIKLLKLLTCLLILGGVGEVSSEYACCADREECPTEQIRQNVAQTELNTDNLAVLREEFDLFKVTTQVVTGQLNITINRAWKFLDKSNYNRITTYLNFNLRYGGDICGGSSNSLTYYYGIPSNSDCLNSYHYQHTDTGAAGCTNGFQFINCGYCQKVISSRSTLNNGVTISYYPEPNCVGTSTSFSYDPFVYTIGSPTPFSVSVFGPTSISLTIYMS